MIAERKARKLRRSSAAVATSREGQRSRISRPAFRRLTELNGECLICLGDVQVPRTFVHRVPPPRMLDEHHFRSLGKPVVGNLDRIAHVDNVGN